MSILCEEVEKEQLQADLIEQEELKKTFEELLRKIKACNVGGENSATILAKWGRLLSATLAEVGFAICTGIRNHRAYVCDALKHSADVEELLKDSEEGTKALENSNLIIAGQRTRIQELEKERKELNKHLPEYLRKKDDA